MLESSHATIVGNLVTTRSLQFGLDERRVAGRQFALNGCYLSQLASKVVVVNSQLSITCGLGADSDALAKHGVQHIWACVGVLAAHVLAPPSTHTARLANN